MTNLRGWLCSGYSETGQFLYIKNEAGSGTGSGRDLIQKIANVEYYMTLLSAFLRCVRYGLYEHLVYPQMVSSYGGGGALLHLWLGSIKSW